LRQPAPVPAEAFPNAGQHTFIQPRRVGGMVNGGDTPATAVPARRTRLRKAFVVAGQAVEVVCTSALW